ncbi:MAG: ABC transporter permease [Oscillospiraceae bacterium]|jgi:putative ABC transport system permease protein|nr:ABC transporter permease [Oscillospiraceae bacterium]
MRALWKDILREMWVTKTRFLSLCIITMLGAMSVVGIQAAAIDMRNIADKTYKEQNLYDIHIKSAVGFTEEDVDAARDIPGVRLVMPTYSFDAYTPVHSGELATARAFALPGQLNRITLDSGALPAKPDEIAIDRRWLREGDFALGDEIVLEDFGVFTITGTVTSPFYITHERGHTALGNGQLRFYGYLHPDAFAFPVYTDLYVLMEGSKEMHQVSEEYDDAAREWKALFEGAGRMVFTREDGTAFSSYHQDTQRLQRIGYVFPMVFFLVAVLVSLTTMSRMVEEQRTQIGVYKALGYRPASIMLKYAVYAVLSGSAGGAAGAYAGSQAFPRIIADAYGHLYSMPPVETPVPWDIAGFAFAASVLSVALATVLSVANAMKGEPAVLMRPRAPKAGKRVLIERISPLWGRLGFLGKVTARNIFRYKRRFLMTLAGVAGCTALLLTAFGLSDSLDSVARLHYTEVVKYDALVYVSGKLEEPINDEHLYIHEESVTVGTVSAALIVPERMEALDNFISLSVPYGGGALLTEKLSRGQGDTIELTVGDNVYTVEVSGITENYIMHYVYMSPGQYKELFGREAVLNGLFIKGEVDAAALMALDTVRAIVLTENMIQTIGDSVDAMGVVTVVLIVLACALAFIVLFNLTNINITERMRELATIKVLGFQDLETAMYIYREGFAVTLMGIAIGLVGGVYLERFIITSVEIDLLKFPTNIYPASFILAAALSLVFSLFVNTVTYCRLVKIDMVESLKNVE